MSGVTTGEFRALQERVEGLADVADRLARAVESISVNTEAIITVMVAAAGAREARDRPSQGRPRGKRHLRAVDGTPGGGVA